MKVEGKNTFGPLARRGFTVFPWDSLHNTDLTRYTASDWLWLKQGFPGGNSYLAKYQQWADCSLTDNKDEYCVTQGHWNEQEFVVSDCMLGRRFKYDSPWGVSVETHDTCISFEIYLWDSLLYKSWLYRKYGMTHSRKKEVTQSHQSWLMPQSIGNYKHYSNQHCIL